MLALLLVCALAVEPAAAQSTLAPTWASRHDGGQNDEPSAVAVDTDGAAYVTGLSGSINHYDMLTVKVDKAGKEAWAARYDGPTNGYDVATAVAVGHAASGDQGIYVAGLSEQRAGDLLSQQNRSD